MENITSIKKKLIDSKLKSKPFSSGMYAFLMFLIDYYRRVRSDLKIDYDSFIIIQVVVSHGIYLIQSEHSKNYSEIAKEFSRMSSSDNTDTSDIVFKASEIMAKIKKNKLTISSICQVTTLPKETVRRKVKTLISKKFLTHSKVDGVLIGPNYRKIYENMTPKTTLSIASLLKKWKKSGVLDSLLEF